MFGLPIKFTFPPKPFKKQFTCFSIAMFPKEGWGDLNQGGRILMPSSVWELFTKNYISHPWTLKLANLEGSRTTHCTVHHFTYYEGNIYVPAWMIVHLGIQEGDKIEMETVSLPVATFARFQPKSNAFMCITNPIAVLQRSLRKFACLTVGDVIVIYYNNQEFEVCVVDTKPENAVSIVESIIGLEIEVIPPLPELETEANESDSSRTYLENQESGFVPFVGKGYRLDGKPIKNPVLVPNVSAIRTPIQRGVPDFDWRPGTITFNRHIQQPTDEDKSKEDKYKPFSGEGYILGR